jgi:hypothetical protein
MLKSGIDQDALIAQFASASAKQTEQLRKAVGDATLAALQGRELSLKNVRAVIKSVTQAASTGAQQNTTVDAESLLDQAVTGMDDALLQAVEANRIALQRFVDQGMGLQEQQLKKAVTDLEKYEDVLLEAVKKSTADATAQMASHWSPVLEKMQAGGTASGHQATAMAEQITEQMNTMQKAVRESRAAGVRAAQTLAESYTALVSGVLIGMSDAIRQAAPAAAKKSAARSKG